VPVPVRPARVRAASLPEVTRPLIEATDRISREIRTVIFGLGPTERTVGLRAQVVTLAEESAATTGLAPTLEFAGPVDTSATEGIGAELVGALRATLDAVARHPGVTGTSIHVAATGAELRLVIVVDGLDGAASLLPDDVLHTVRARAARVGGSAFVTTGPARQTTVAWQVTGGRALADPA